MIRSKIAIVLVSAVVLLAVGLMIAIGMAANSHRRFREVARNFGSIRNGDSREVVMRILGEPNNHDGQCVEELGPSKDCATELIYSDPSELIFGNFYVVEFSADKRVIAAYHFK